MAQSRLLHGWDSVSGEWIPLQVDASGYIKVDLSEVNLGDLGDVNAPSPADDDSLTWDAASEKWVPQAPVSWSKVVWKDASQQAYYASGPSAFDWTDLDLTAYTSANAKLAILLIGFHVDSGGSAGEIFYGVRKNGTTPSQSPFIKFYNVELDGSLRYVEVIVGMDAGQVIEHRLALGTGASLHTAQIDVLGYIE